jgi:hypothetical protein
MIYRLGLGTALAVVLSLCACAAPRGGDDSLPLPVRTTGNEVDDTATSAHTPVAVNAGTPDASSPDASEKDGSASFVWAFVLTDTNGCHSCTLGCDAVCDSSNVGQRKACRQPGTKDNDDVYLCVVESASSARGALTLP